MKNTTSYVRVQDSLASITAWQSAKQVVEAAKEILRRRQKITSVPDIASPVFYAYQKRFEDYLTLKERQVDTMTPIYS